MKTNDMVPLAMLLSVVEEACSTRTLHELDSWGRSAYASAMRLLAGTRVLEIASDAGPAVSARLTPGGVKLLTGMATAAKPPDIAINGMKHADFHLGMAFFTAAGRWRVTDVGTRTVIAIKLEQDDPRHYNGPPYSIVENVFDENDFGGCEPAAAR